MKAIVRNIIRILCALLCIFGVALLFTMAYELSTKMPLSYTSYSSIFLVLPIPIVLTFTSYFVARYYDKGSIRAFLILIAFISFGLLSDPFWEMRNRFAENPEYNVLYDGIFIFGPLLLIIITYKIISKAIYHTIPPHELTRG